MLSICGDLYIYNVPYCSLYDEGFKRLGCIGCPMASATHRKKQFERWPRYEKLWKDAVRIAFEGKPKKIKELYKDWEDFYNDWLDGKVIRKHKIS